MGSAPNKAMDHKNHSTDKQKNFYVIGHPITHSFSPVLHHRLGIDSYYKKDVDKDELASFIKSDTWQGLNVTIPHKQAVLAFAGKVSPICKRLGSCNTLLRRDNTIYAYNTDYFGFWWLINQFAKHKLIYLDAKQGFSGKQIAVLGTGGASKAVIAVLEDLGAKPLVIGRTSVDNYHNFQEVANKASLIVNTTPCGMSPHIADSPLTLDDIQAMECLEGVIDIIYNPSKTKLCALAEELCVPYITGLPMLVAQAWAAQQLFLGKIQDDRRIELSADDIKQCISTTQKLDMDMRNIIFIGMPGVGKTSRGKNLAKITRRPFIDCDQEFQRTYNISCADFIATHGEDKFRELETEVLQKVCAKHSQVISCGGGVVERDVNRRIISANSKIVYLHKPLSCLAQNNRPLSQAYGVEALAQRREAKYELWSDLHFECSYDPYKDCVRIAHHLNLHKNPPLT